ncbi:MAG: acyltransferase [Pseudomonadota bacterium]
MHSQRLIWLDALRLIAGVSMVGLHSTADATGQPFVDWPIEDRWGPLLIRAVIYTARTELFLVISIFLLLMALERRPRDYGSTIREQAQRLLVPFAFWTVFYAFYSLIKASYFGYDAWLLAELAKPLTWVDYFLLGSSKYHMHFLPTLFGLVLFFPFFKLAKDHVWLGAVILACLLAKRELDVFLWGNLAGEPGFDYLLRAIKILTYTGYGFVAAALLGLWERWGRQQDLSRWVAPLALLGVMLFLIKLVGAWKTAHSGAWPHNYVAGYWADFLFPCLLFAICMVLAHRAWPAVISRVAKYSFGIYLCHPIFLDLIEVAISSQDLAPLEQVLIKMILGIFATSGFVLILEKTRPLAWTVGLGRQPNWLLPLRALTVASGRVASSSSHLNRGDQK